MDALENEFDKLAGRYNLGNAVGEIEKCIAMLEQVRAGIAAGEF